MTTSPIKFIAGQNVRLAYMLLEAVDYGSYDMLGAFNTKEEAEHAKSLLEAYFERIPPRYINLNTPEVAYNPEYDVWEKECPVIIPNPENPDQILSLSLDKPMYGYKIQPVWVPQTTVESEKQNDAN